MIGAVPHLGFIVAAYLVTALVLCAVVTGILLDGRTQARLLAELERRARGEPSEGEER